MREATILDEEGKIKYEIVEYRAIMNPREVRRMVLLDIGGMLYTCNFTTKGLYDENFHFTPTLERVPSPEGFNRKVRATSYDDSYNTYHLVEDEEIQALGLLERVLERKKDKIVHDFTHQREYTEDDHIDDILHHRDIRDFLRDMEEDLGLDPIVDRLYEDD